MCTSHLAYPKIKIMVQLKLSQLLLYSEFFRFLFNLCTSQWSAQHSGRGKTSCPGCSQTIFILWRQKPLQWCVGFSPRRYIHIITATINGSVLWGFFAVCRWCWASVFDFASFHWEFWQCKSSLVGWQLKPGGQLDWCFQNQKSFLCLLWGHSVGSFEFLCTKCWSSPPYKNNVVQIKF